MLKMTGLALLFAGCLSLGFTGSVNLRRRLELLEEFRRVLLLLSGEIRCIHSTLPEAFSRAREKAAEPYKGFLLAAAAEMEGGTKKPLGDIFRGNQKLLEGNALLKADRDMILELGDQLGYLDIAMQLKTLEFCGEMLEEAIQKAAADYQGKAGMYRYLGVLAGLFLVVLLA